MSSPTLNVVVRNRRMLTDQICEFELGPLPSGVLPAFSAGAHINVRTPGGQVRSYSLCNDPHERHRYVIGVKRDTVGRGGSVSLVNHVAAGDVLSISAPLNSFSLIDARNYLLIAGGIGITPILSMLRALHRRGGSDFRLIYCTRSRAETPFVEELEAFGDLVTIHHDAGRMESAFDFWPHLAIPADTHIYCCGPTPLMEHVRALTMHWPESRIHFEDFGGVKALGIDARPFRIRRKNSREVIPVGANETALDALLRAGLHWPSSCGSGVCGTCRIPLSAGAVLHRDLVLSESERAHYLMPCVSRAAGDEIELEF